MISLGWYDMTHQGLIDYITNARKNKMHDKDIKEQLLKAGWKEDMINEGFKELQSDEVSSNKTNVLAILSLVFSFLFSPVGLILGIISLKQIKKTSEKGKGLAIAGVIISLISIIIFVVVIGFTIYASMGILNLERYIPQRCDFGYELECIGPASISVGRLDFIMKNHLRNAILIEDVKVNDCSSTMISLNGNEYTDLESLTIEPEQMFYLRKVGCGTGKVKDSYRRDVYIKYTNQESDLSYTVEGLILGRVN